MTRARMRHGAGAQSPHRPRSPLSRGERPEPLGPLLRPSLPACALGELLLLPQPALSPTLENTTAIHSNSNDDTPTGLSAWRLQPAPVKRQSSLIIQYVENRQDIKKP